MNALTVYCASCRRAQPDEGTGKTCIYCGCSPVPSYSYPKDCSFYPKAKPSLMEQLQQRRKGRQ